MSLLWFIGIICIFLKLSSLEDRNNELKNEIEELREEIESELKNVRKEIDEIIDKTEEDDE